MLNFIKIQSNNYSQNLKYQINHIKIREKNWIYIKNYI